MTSAKGLSRIGDILDIPFSTSGFDKVVKGLFISRIWRKTVGPTIAKKTIPLKLAGKTLYVTVATSTWLEELKYLKGDIINKINNELQEQAVEEIVFRLGKIAEKDTSKQSSDSNHQPLSCHVSQKEIDNIEKLVKHIKNEELRETIRRAMINKRNCDLNIAKR
ncbi:MAG: DUF721 domain-containing protein [Deltaproteobacteria bacterium]|nr:DUF721 domain-containing protein [Deltaproteobacteria bacterium]MBI3754864.1 DUF721 domain-containing protein [Deltaproteobacteria bacterium]